MTNQEELDKAMKELDALEKSEKTEISELDELTKALEAELGDDLNKSHKEPDADDKGGPSDGDEDNEDEEDEEDCEKAEREAFEDELIKASQAYADLEKSVFDGMSALHDELDVIKKSLAAMLNLNIKQAHVIAALSKSRDEDVDRISKSVETLAAAPVATNKAVLGVDDRNGSDEPLQKSNAEIQEALIKAIDEGTVEARNLSVFSTFKDVNRLPEDVRKAIGF